MLFSDKYKEIQSSHEARYVERSSLFISLSFKVYSLESIKTHLSDVKKKYKKATHYCYAYILNADKKMVINGNNSDFYIVVANLNNSVSLFLVDSCSEGIDIKTDVLMDAGSYSSIKFKNVVIPKKNKLDIKVEGVNILNKILDIASIGLSCEMLGSVQAAFEQTINYLKERQQFGKKIGS